MEKNYDNQNPAMELSLLLGILENINEALVTIDQESTVHFFNKAAEDIFGYQCSDVIGHNLSEILAPRCREEHNHAVKHFVKTGKATLIGHETEFNAMRKNGSTFPASISFSMTKVGNDMFFTGIVRDTTETKTLQENLIRSERLAALGQTVAEITHEIRNPLMLIGGFARQLIKSVSGKKDQEKLSIIAGEIVRLENMLTDVKSLYTPWSLVIEKFDVHDLLEEIHHLVSTSNVDKKFTVHLKTSEKSPVIEGDREKLKQVVLNIMKNSIEALPDGGVMSLEMEERGDSIEITVKDQGHGIPKELQEKIFNPYFTTKKGGTGLGLCVSRRIVEDHKGSSLTIESEEGKGTTVTISLACKLPG